MQDTETNNEQNGVGDARYESSVRTRCSSRILPENTQSNYQRWKVFKRFVGWVRPHWKWLTFLCICMVVNQALVVVMPLSFGWAFDSILPSHNAHALNLLALGLCAFLIIRSITMYLERETAALVGSLVVRDVRKQMHGHLLNMSLRFLDNYQVGRIVSRVLGDTECVRALLLSGFVNGSASLVRLIFILATLIAIDWRTTAISSFTVPIFLFGFWHSANKLKPAYRQLNDDNTLLSACVNETFSGMRVVKTYRGERRANLDFVMRLHALLRRHLFVCRTQHLITVFWEATACISVIAMLWYGGHRVLEGSMTIGELVAFYGLLGQLHGPINDLIALNATLQPAIASIENLDVILEQQPEITDRADAIAAKRLNGQVEVSNVDFSYIKNQSDHSKTRQPKTLDKIAFQAKAGDCIAIVGASGSGKSTLINLLARLYDVDHGCIRVDGVDIRKYRIQSYLSNIAVVLQENFLFKGSFRDNIRYSRWAAREEEIVSAAKMAGAWEFICARHEGLDSACGENGFSLSGGQKQRIALARAILAKPSILILDEATSALDTHTEKQVQLALDTVMENCTTFIVAHRLSTIRNADKILVMHDGMIAECGTHSELLSRGGAYASMHHAQFSDTPPEPSEITIKSESEPTINLDLVHR